MVYYIFLDIDGVLNDEDYIIKAYEKNGGYAMNMSHVPFDPAALENLMEMIKIIRNYGEPRIILSSTWRLSDIDTAIVKARLAEYGLQLNGKTPYNHMNRGIEIQDFLSVRAIDYKLVILDDDTFDITPIYPDNLVAVDRKIGLQWEDCKKALNILNIIDF